MVTSPAQSKVHGFHDCLNSETMLRVWRLAFGVWRLAFGVRRSAFGVWRLAFGVRARARKLGLG